MEGALLCRGDFTMVLNYNLDTASTRKTSTHISRYMNLQLKELGITDIWSDIHTPDRD